MSKQIDCCSIRRNNRWDCDLAGSLRVEDVHREQVVFSRTVVESGGIVPVRIIDCSEGGLGLRSSVYLPRGTEVIVGFCVPGEAGHELHLRVQRGAMVDRTPGYYLGTSVVTTTGSAEALASLLAFAERNQGSVGEAA